jgi:hypothetical protein
MHYIETTVIHLNNKIELQKLKLRQTVGVAAPAQSR